MLCYLALTLDSTTLMAIQHDCVNADGTSSGEAAWKCVLYRFRSNETPTVVTIVSQLARLNLIEGEGIEIFFIRAGKLYSRLQQARPEALEQNGITERANTIIVELARRLLLQAKLPGIISSELLQLLDI